MKTILALFTLAVFTSGCATDHARRQYTYRYRAQKGIEKPEPSAASLLPPLPPTQNTVVSGATPLPPTGTPFAPVPGAPTSPPSGVPDASAVPPAPGVPGAPAVDAGATLPAPVGTTPPTP